MTFKMLLASWFLVHLVLFERFRSFDPVNKRSVGQRAAKLQPIKHWERFDPGWSWMRADWLECGRDQVADFFLRYPTLTANNFKALWTTDSIFTAFKDLNLLKKYTRNQEACSISRVISALSKWPHLHRVYLIRASYSFGTTVFSVWYIV